MKKDLSLVIPVYNEEESLGFLWQELEKLIRRFPRCLEIIFVDDHSHDNSFKILKDIENKCREINIKIIRFKRNFGQTPALAAGIDHAKGDIIVTLDADLQNDPQDIPLLVEELEKGYDVVVGWRKKRQDPFFSRIVPSFFANQVISWYTGVKLHDYGCSLKAYRKDLVKDLRLYGELHRFIPALLSWSGAKIKELVVCHHPRKFGKSKYGISRTLNVLLDMLTVKFLLISHKGPMRIFGRLGLVSFLLGLLSGLASLVMKVTRGIDMTGNPLLYLTVFLWIMCLHIVSIGFLGEINVRIYDKTHDIKIYVIEETVN